MEMIKAVHRAAEDVNQLKFMCGYNVEFTNYYGDSHTKSISGKIRSLDIVLTKWLAAI